MEKVFRQVKKGISFVKGDTLDFPAHIHEDIELIFVKKGGGNAYCEGKKYKLEENSFFLVFPNQVHHYSESIKGEYITLILKSRDLLSYGNVFQEGVPLSPVWENDITDDEHIKELLESIFDEFAKEGQSTIVEAYLTALFGKLLKHYQIEKTRVANDTLSQILQYCAEHYKDNISVAEVAAKSNISRSSVSHLFNAKLAMNFCDYINSLRLSDAVKLLKNSGNTITDVSYLSGFSTIRTFNRAFLKRYGVSPSEYRKHM